MGIFFMVTVITIKFVLTFIHASLTSMIVIVFILMDFNYFHFNISRIRSFSSISNLINAAFIAAL